MKQPSLEEILVQGKLIGRKGKSEFDARKRGSRVKSSADWPKVEVD